MTDLVIESINKSDLFWDATKKEFRELWYADVFPTLEKANKELRECIGKGYVRYLTADEQSIFDNTAND